MSSGRRGPSRIQAVCPAASETANVSVSAIVEAQAAAVTRAAKTAVAPTARIKASRRDPAARPR